MGTALAATRLGLGEADVLGLEGLQGPAQRSEAACGLQHGCALVTHRRVHAAGQPHAADGEEARYNRVARACVLV